MATNLEFKAQCQSFKDLYPKLAELNARHCETVHQIDTYFFILNGKDGLTPKDCKPRLKLRETEEADEGWLIYYERPNQHTSRYSQYHLSKTDEPSTLKTLLTAALGVETIVEKRREIWMFKNTRIHLDTVTDLGEYIELETVFKGQTEAEAIAEHQHVKNILHLDTADPVACSYSDLILLRRPRLY